MNVGIVADVRSEADYCCVTNERRLLSLVHTSVLQALQQWILQFGNYELSFTFIACMYYYRRALETSLSNCVESTTYQ